MLYTYFAKKKVAKDKFIVLHISINTGLAQQFQVEQEKYSPNVKNKTNSSIQLHK